MKRGSVRVIAGMYRGRKIFYGESGELRPTPDRVRENLFNILQHDIPGARVLDLFAGTGAFGIEALSRGAEYAVFTDKSGDRIKSIKQNLDAFNVPAGKYRAAHSDYAYALKAMARERFDIMFADPPFDSDFYGDCIKMLVEGPASDGGVIVVETAADKVIVLPENAAVTDERVYGSIKLLFLQKQQQ